MFPRSKVLPGSAGRQAGWLDMIFAARRRSMWRPRGRAAEAAPRSGSRAGQAAAAVRRRPRSVAGRCWRRHRAARDREAGGMGAACWTPWRRCSARCWAAPPSRTAAPAGRLAAGTATPPIRGCRRCAGDPAAARSSGGPTVTAPCTGRPLWAEVAWLYAPRAHGAGSLLSSAERAAETTAGTPR